MRRRSRTPPRRGKKAIYKNQRKRNDTARGPTAFETRLGLLAVVGAYALLYLLSRA